MSVLLSKFANLPEDVKYRIYEFSIYTPSAVALKTYLKWYESFLNWNNNNQISFKNYYFTKLKHLDSDLFLTLINYKIARKRRIL
jgi:hypothetical protein